MMFFFFKFSWVFVKIFVSLLRNQKTIDMEKFWDTLFGIIFVIAIISSVTLLVSVIFTWKMVAIFSLAALVPSALIILFWLFCTTDTSGNFSINSTMGLGIF